METHWTSGYPIATTASSQAIQSFAKCGPHVQNPGAQKSTFPDSDEHLSKETKPPVIAIYTKLLTAPPIFSSPEVNRTGAEVESACLFLLDLTMKIIQPEAAVANHVFGSRWDGTRCNQGEDKRGRCHIGSQTRVEIC